MIAVIGATGKVGSELLPLLTSRQESVRALAHSEGSVQRLNSMGVETVQGSYTDVDDLNRLLSGADKLFLLTPSAADQVETERRIIDAAKANGMQHIVYLSVFEADTDITAMRLHYGTEQYLKASGVAYTILRPHNFMQNFNTANLPTILHQGGIFNPAGEQPLSFVDARDIAAVAVAALTQPEHLGKTYDITGGEAFTYAEAAAKIGEKLNKSVQYVYVPPQAFRDSLMQVGVPEFYAEMLAEMYDYWNKNGAGRVSPEVERILGRKPYTFDEYLAAYIGHFEPA